MIRGSPIPPYSSLHYRSPPPHTRKTIHKPPHMHKREEPSHLLPPLILLPLLWMKINWGLYKAHAHFMFLASSMLRCRLADFGFVAFDCSLHVGKIHLNKQVSPTKEEKENVHCEWKSTEDFSSPFSVKHVSYKGREIKCTLWMKINWRLLKPVLSKTSLSYKGREIKCTVWVKINYRISKPVLCLMLRPRFTGLG
jgi:hypothetical protein